MELGPAYLYPILDCDVDDAGFPRFGSAARDGSKDRPMLYSINSVLSPLSITKGHKTSRRSVLNAVMLELII